MANEPKPFMIRGDRLLLALEVMHHCAVPRRGDGLSIKRIRRALRRTFRRRVIVPAVVLGVRPFMSFTQEVTEHALREGISPEKPLWFLLSFMEENASLAMVELNIARFVEPTHEGNIRLFFERIASGELTEEDFMERSAP